jgi:outer membrane cobalamin receptor
MKRWGLGLMMAGLLALAPVGWAQEVKDGGSAEINLKTTEVVSTPIVQSQETDRYGQEKLTVSDQQTEDLNAGDLSSALRRAPGVNISRYNMVGAFGGGDGGAIYIRGMGAERPGAEISVMFDGVPKANSIWVHPLLDTVSTDVAGRIDIYKSPQPVFIGNMALGAVDIVPKSMNQEGHLIRLRSGGGTYGTWFETLEGGQMAGPWDIYFVQSVRESEGHRDHSSGRVQAYYVGTGYRVNDNVYVSLKAMHTDGTAEDPGPNTAKPPKRNTFNNQNDTMTFTVYNHFDWGEGYIKGYVDRGYINWKEPTDDSNTPWQNYGLRARQTVRVGPVELLGGVDETVLAAEWIQEGLNGKRKASLPYETWRLWEPYAGVSVTLGDRDGFYFIPSYSRRWQQHSEFGNRESWQAGVVAGYKDVEVHANWAHGYNYPGQYVRAYYNVFWSFVPTYHGDEWKRLEPEENDHWEVGAQVKVADKAKLNVTYFNERAFHRIVVVAPPPPPPRLAQVGELYLSGLDSSLVVTPVDNLSIYAGYTRIWPDRPSQPARAPETTASVGMDLLLLDQIKINVDYLKVSDQYVYNSRDPGKGDANVKRIDGYGLVNAKVSYLFKQDQYSGEVWVAAENLGDQKYEYLPHYPMPGTTWMGGVSLSLE